MRNAILPGEMIDVIAAPVTIPSNTFMEEIERMDGFLNQCQILDTVEIAQEWVDVNKENHQRRQLSPDEIRNHVQWMARVVHENYYTLYYSPATGLVVKQIGDRINGPVDKWDKYVERMGA